MPPGQARKPTTPTTPTGSGSVPSAGSPAVPASSPTSNVGGKRLHSLGTWLDNAEINAPGEAWMSLATAYWRSDSLREIDAPSIGLSVGVAPRVQFGVSLPYYHVTDRSGSSAHGFGASYLTSKIALGQGSRVRAATSPTLEILNWSSPEEGIQRVNWIIPVSIQADIAAARTYVTGGYVSRGSVFGSGAVEWSAGSRLTLLVNVAHSYSVVDDPASDALGISRHRTDAGAGAYITVTPSLVLFTNVGRTFAPVNDTSSRLSVSAGIAVNVAGPATTSPRPP